MQSVTSGGVFYNIGVVGNWPNTHTSLPAAVVAVGWVQGEDTVRRNSVSIGIGLLLVLAGTLFLLQNFGIVRFAWDILWTLLFVAGGAAFLVVFVSNSHDNWWAAIPGFTLAGLGGLIAMGTLFPSMAARFGGSFFLGSIGLAFWAVYAVRRENWWAVIPGGVLFTLAFVAFIAPGEDSGFGAGGAFFLGLALTFALVYFLPTPEGRMRWALIPAGVLGLMGVLMIAAMGSLINYIWPIALIGGGLVLVLRTLRRTTGE
jgi:hypothetical protein